ncbi:Holliday junction branch migration protein RuvA [Patescibacteria group bacterium]|nr:Holliday junction branch migration protein RuvA [Patescibacteria group bacterium]MBU1867907.1 Holliday junction branch migration protein RuvA [Patescibacteria group bacterium]
MIFKLKGTIEYKHQQSLIVNTGPVALETLVPTSLLTETKQGETIDLFTYLHVRENQLVLFGFKQLNQRTLFTSLIDISGIGPKGALGILSQASVEEITKAVNNNNTLLFTSVPGIGKKNANRIILELKSKLGEDTDLDLSQLVMDKGSKQVVSALHTLGYTKQEALTALQKIDPGLSLEQRIKECLKVIGSH